MNPEDNDECPICHTQRYLRRDMRFLINPECYHKMCEGCVDRIFSHGPAPCPVAGCNKTLRRQRFRLPTFEDLALEREIDIRRTVARVFNRREEEFEDLRAWNDYLNDVEDVTFNLIHGVDVDATQRKLARYAEQNAQSIAENKQVEIAEIQETKHRLVEEEEYTRRLRDAAVDEQALERLQKEGVRRQIIENLAGGGDAYSIARDGERALTRRPGQNAGQQKRTTEPIGGAAGMGYESFTIAGLRKRGPIEPEEIYDPFGGLDERREYVTLPDRLDGLWEDYLGKTRTERKVVASGYRLDDFVQRALCESFGGLGVFIGEEMGKKDEKRRRRQAANAAASAVKVES